MLGNGAGLAAARPDSAVQDAKMLTQYIAAAMRHATYEILPEDRTYYGEIPGFQGVWSNADTLEACREELQEVLEEWLVFGLRLDHPLPTVDGLALTFAAVD